MKTCQVGWIDVFWWNDWQPGEKPESNVALRAYEEKLKRHIIKRRYSPLSLEGITVRVELGEYDDDDGADLSLYAQFLAHSVQEFAQKAQSCITYIPDGHAFDVLYGNSVCLTEDDFEGDGRLTVEARKRLRRLDAREKKAQDRSAPGSFRFSRRLARLRY